MKTTLDLLQILHFFYVKKNCHQVRAKGALIFNKNIVQKMINCNVLTNDVPMWPSVYGIPVPAHI